MSRARGARETEATDFLQNNPTLIEFTTEIEVVQNDNGNHVLEVTQDGGTPEQTDVPDTNLKFWKGPIEGSIPGIVTVESAIEGPNFGLDAEYLNWRKQEKDASIVLTELGIGVTSGGDVLGVLLEAIKGDPDLDDLIGFVAASPHETLQLSLDDRPLESGGPFDFGGTSITFGIDILDGEGQIEVVLIDDEGLPSEHLFNTEVEVAVEVESSSGAGRARAAKQAQQQTEPQFQTVEEITAVMAEGQTFESVEISTTGDLEISVTGIDFTTGYVESFLPT